MAAFETRLPFASDYMMGAHPAVLRALTESNLIPAAGYGEDQFCAAAREKIRAACACPEAEIHFLVGGTQTNAAVIDSLLRPYQGVLAPESGHIAVHEAGAIEYGGHKVLPLPSRNGKLCARDVERAVLSYRQDETREHTVMPAMVYISQPSELGTLYSLSELRALHEICRKYGLWLYADGARLAYALASPENDVSLPALAELCDIFYIGGTKCGALFGEAVVIPTPGLIPHFFTMIKQHGALLAKGRLLGVQFDALFTDSLYLTLGSFAVDAAIRLRHALREYGYELRFDSVTNQSFAVVDHDRKERLRETVNFSPWEPVDKNRSIIRFVTSWATTETELRALIALLK